MEALGKKRATGLGSGQAHPRLLRGEGAFSFSAAADFDGRWSEGSLKPTKCVVQSWSFNVHKILKTYGPKVVAAARVHEFRGVGIVQKRRPFDRG